MFAPPAAVLAPLFALPPLGWQRPAADPEQMAAAMGIGLAVLVVGGLIGLAIGTVIGAVFLRLSAGWVAKEEIDFGDACVTMLASTFATAVITFLIGLVVGFFAGVAGAPLWAAVIFDLMALPLPFLIQAKVISGRHDLSFGQGALITLVMSLMGFVVAVVVVLTLVAVALAFGAFNGLGA